MEYDDAMSKVKTLALILRDKVDHANAMVAQYEAKEFDSFAQEYRGYALACEHILDLLKLAGFDIGDQP